MTPPPVYVYLSWVLADHPTPAARAMFEATLDTLAHQYGGECCGGGTWYGADPIQRERDYEFTIPAGRPGPFLDAVRTEHPTVQVRLGAAQEPGT